MKKILLTEQLILHIQSEGSKQQESYPASKTWLWTCLQATLCKGHWSSVQHINPLFSFSDHSGVRVKIMIDKWRRWGHGGTEEEKIDRGGNAESWRTNLKSGNERAALPPHEASKWPWPRWLDSPMGQAFLARLTGSLPHITKWLLWRDGTHISVEDSDYADPEEGREMSSRAGELSHHLPPQRLLQDWIRLHNKKTWKIYAKDHWSPTLGIF